MSKNKKKPVKKLPKPATPIFGDQLLEILHTLMAKADETKTNPITVHGRQLIERYGMEMTAWRAELTKKPEKNPEDKKEEKKPEEKKEEEKPEETKEEPQPEAS